MRELVSIIVPIYNTEEYVDKCIESIVSQTYENLQIILINDGSTDLSGEKCDVWKEKDRRVVVIHQENKGVSAARNAGINRSTGKWIAFIDSDDYVEKKYVEKLALLNETWRTEISCCQSNMLESVIVKSEGYMESDQFLLSQSYRTALWYYMYKKELFDKIVFPEGKLSEDAAVLYKVIYQARRVAVTSDILYHRTIREGSLSNKGQGLTRCDIDRIDILKEKAEFFEKKKEKDLADNAWKDYLANILVVYNSQYAKEFQVNRKELLKKYRKQICKVRKNRMISWKLKFLLLASGVYPTIWKLF